MSFRYKTIISIALIEIIFLSVMVYSGLNLITLNAEKEFKNRSIATTKALAVAATDSLISMDLAKLQSLVDEMLSYPGVLYAQVYNEQNQLMVKAGHKPISLKDNIDFRNIEFSFTSTSTSTLSFKSAITLADITYGYVEIGLSIVDLIENKILFYQYGIGLAMIEVALVAFLSFILGDYLTRHLQLISTASFHISQGNLGVKIPIKGNDELAQTAKAFNQMSEMLKQSYSIIKKREKYLQNILDNVIEGIITCNEKGLILEMSENAKKILCIKNNDYLNQCLTNFIDSVEIKLFYTNINANKSVLNKNIYGLVNNNIISENTPIEIYIFEIYHDDGLFYVFVIKDITERLKSEDNMRLRNSIISSSTNGIAILNAKFKNYPFEYVNPAFEHITGYSHEEVIGLSLDILQGVTTDQKSVNKIFHALENKKYVKLTILHFTKHGKSFWNELSILPIRFKHTKVTHFFIEFTNVTDRVNSQIELAKSENFMRMVLNSTNDAIIVINSTGMIESFNKGAETMFGYENNEIVGRNVTLLMPSAFNGKHTAAMASYVNASHSHVIGKNLELEAKRKNGTSFPIILQVNELYQDNVRYFLGVIHDITPLRKKEGELRKSLREKEILLKEIHHRVKNNLLVVSSILEMQQEYTDNQAVIKILKESQDRIYSMSLIHDVLSRSLGTEEIDTRLFLEHLIEYFRSMYATEGKTIIIHSDIDHLFLNIETVAPLSLIINELIANCFEHAFVKTTVGDIWVFFKVIDEQKMRLIVQDNGVGLPPNFNINNFNSLGLQLISLLAQQLCAEIHITSEDNTIFNIEFSKLDYAKRL